MLRKPQIQMAHALYKQQDTKSSMYHLSKSKGGTSPKHSDGFHMEINAATESLGFAVDEDCLLWAVSVCFYTMPVVSAPLLNQLLWASLLRHKFCKQNIQCGKVQCNYSLVSKHKRDSGFDKVIRLNTQFPDKALGQPFLVKQGGRIRLTGIPILFFTIRFYTFLLGVQPLEFFSY